MEFRFRVMNKRLGLGRDRLAVVIDIYKHVVEIIVVAVPIERKSDDAITAPIAAGQTNPPKKAIIVQKKTIRNALDTSWTGVGRIGFTRARKISMTTAAIEPLISQPAKFEAGTP